MRVWDRCLITFGLLLAAPLSLASEGAIEINAACVADGCFAGDSPGFPVNITAPGSYVLTSNLTVSGTSGGISVAANDVTLDLNGFSVRGPVTCSGMPVTSCTSTSGSSGIYTSERATVRNGTVTGFGGYGIATSQDSHVHNVTVSHNGSGGVSPYYTTVSDSVIVRNGGNGLTATSGGGNAKVINCQFRGNEVDGADISMGLVLDSAFINNGRYGLNSSSGGSNAAYANNQFLSNNGGGSQVNGGVSIGCNLVGGLSSCP